MRKYIQDTLVAQGIDVYSPGKVTSPKPTPYVVMRIFDDSLASNPIGSHVKFDIMCYVPDTSIYMLDTFIEKVKGILVTSNIADEFDGMNGDYHDTTVSAYMRNIKFKVPHTTN